MLTFLKSRVLFFGQIHGVRGLFVQFAQQFLILEDFIFQMLDYIENFFLVMAVGTD